MLIKLKMKSVKPPFISRTIIGETHLDNNFYVLKNCVEHFEFLVQKQQVNPITRQNENVFDITNLTMSNDVMSEGVLEISADEVEILGEINPSDKLFSVWQKALDQYKLSSSRIAPPTLADVTALKKDLSQ